MSSFNFLKLEWGDWPEGGGHGEEANVPGTVIGQAAARGE